MSIIRRSTPRLMAAALVILYLVMFSGCEKSETPEPVFFISLYSGDEQQSKLGTTLPEPLKVRVTYTDGAPVIGEVVRFRVISGDASVAASQMTTNTGGFALTWLRLGASVGEVTVRATTATDNSKYVEFTATSSQYYCDEENPTFTRKFNNRGDLFLFTRKSSLNQQNGQTVSGLVKIQTDFIQERVSASSVKKFEDGYSITVVRDAAFSPSGDFYLSWKYLRDEVLKIRWDYTNVHFAELESYMGSEITGTPDGILIGCDEMGPFAVGCRDTIMRFAEALYSGDPADRANNDAVAVDPNTEDVYFIYLPDATLRRLALDSLVVDTLETVCQLTRDEADGANGMVCGSDGTVYILVDTPGTKELLSVTPAGAKNVLCDFFDRGSGDAAGTQNDLAIWQLNQNEALLYTVDTLNDVLLVYRTLQQELVVMPPDTTALERESLSTASSSGERVGLVVLP